MQAHLQTACHHYHILLLKSMNTYTNTPTHALAAIGQNGTVNYAMTGQSFNKLDEAVNFRLELLENW